MNVISETIRTIQVKVISIKEIEHPRIKALSTIELESIARIAGIKVIQGDHNLYCCPPNMSQDEWMKKVFKDFDTALGCDEETNLWTIPVDKKILKENVMTINPSF